MLKYCQQLYPSSFKHMEKGTHECCMLCLGRKQNEGSEIFKTPPWFSTWHEEKRKPSHWCVWGAPGAHHSDRLREKTSFISMTWKSCELITSKEVLIAVFQSKKQPLHFLEHRRKWMPAFQPHFFISLLPLNHMATPLFSFPKVAPCEGGNCWGEGVKAMIPQEGSCCVQLTPAQLTSIHWLLTSLMAKSAVSISIPRWTPAAKLSPLAPCPGIQKHPQTHPCAKKHMPRFPHHSRQCKGVSPLP